MKTPAAWKTLFESSAFARQTNYSGPLGPEYNPSGTRLRLWAPTAQKVSVNLYRRGDGGACMGTCRWNSTGRASGRSICPATSTDITIPLPSR